MAKRPITTADLERLIAVHHGKLSAIAADLTAHGRPVSRQAVTVWIQDAGLDELATLARARAGISGPRTSLAHGSANPAAERERILAGVKQAGSFTAAAEQLGISRRALYRRRKRLKVAPTSPVNRG